MGNGFFKKKSFGARLTKNGQFQDEMKEGVHDMNSSEGVSVTPDQSGLFDSGSEHQHEYKRTPEEGDPPPIHPVYTRSIQVPKTSTLGGNATTPCQTSTELQEVTDPVVSVAGLQEPPVPLLHPTAQQPNPESVNADVRMRPSTPFPSPDVQPVAAQASFVNPATSIPACVYSDQLPVAPSLLEVPLPLPLSPSTLVNTALQEQVQPRRTRIPRPDGKVTLLAVVDQELHARVKSAAKQHKVSLKTMVEIMIKNCFPAT